jgi:hypothetical protein
MKTLISFRLRKELDADLIALEVDNEKLKELCRDGLRLMLGIRTAKQVLVSEKSIVLPLAKEKTAQLQGKPAVVYVPKKS